MRTPVWAGMPRTISVIGARFKVGTVKDLKVPVEHVAAADVAPHGEWVHDDLLPVNGVCDRDAGVMFLEAELGYDRAREVILHETIHAVIGQSGVHKDILHGHEEALVNRISPILLAVIRDNPKLIEFLTDRRLGGAGSATYWRNHS